MMTSFPGVLRLYLEPAAVESILPELYITDYINILAQDSQDIDLSIFANPDIQIRILGILRTRDFGAL